MSDERDKVINATYKALLLAINEYYGTSIKFVPRTIYSDYWYNPMGSGGSGGTSPTSSCIADYAVADYAVACSG